jgi:hypothetical protein
MTELLSENHGKCKFRVNQAQFYKVGEHGRVLQWLTWSHARGNS